MAEMKVSWDFGSAVFKPWLDLNRHVYILDTSSKLGKEEKQDQEKKIQSGERRIVRNWEELGEGNKCNQNVWKQFLNKKLFIIFFLEKESSGLKKRRLIFPDKCTKS